MLKPFVLGLAIALAITVPASAQSQNPPSNETPSTNQAETQLIGFPVYSSDGEQMGQVVQVAMADGKLRAVRAELGEFLGLGTATVVIDADVVEQKADRLEVGMTAEEVRKAVNSRKR
jgi:hypothetical protein